MEPKRLETHCLKQVNKDLLRHVQKWKSEKDNKSSLYRFFGKLYGSEMVRAFCNISVDLLRTEFHLFGTPAHLDAIEPYLLGAAESFPDVYSHLLDVVAGVQNIAFFINILLLSGVTLPPVSRRNPQAKISTTDYIDVVNFIFNSDLCNISLRVSMNQIITTAIASNCKKLRRLSIKNESWDELNTDFFKSLENLVSLDLNYCLIPIAPTMKIIANYLVNLTVLRLYKSSINDEGLLILCGHEFPSTNSIPSCALTKHCSVNTKMKLRCLIIEKSRRITRKAVACVLTHIQTLECLKVTHLERPSAGNQRLVLPQVIFEINESRKAINMPILQFQIYRLEFMKDSRVLTACLAACPKLQTLCLDFADEQISGSILAENELGCLKVLRIKCFSISQISMEEFDPFWTKYGSQIEELQVCSTDQRLVEADVYGIRKILASCRGVKSLELRDFEVSFVPTIYAWEEHPLLGDVQHLTVTARGEMRSVSIFLYKLIESLRDTTKDLGFWVPSRNCFLERRSDVLDTLKEFIRDTEHGWFGLSIVNS